MLILFPFWCRAHRRFSIKNCWPTEKRNEWQPEKLIFSLCQFELILSWVENYALFSILKPAYANATGMRRFVQPPLLSCELADVVSWIKTKEHCCVHVGPRHDWVNFSSKGRMSLLHMVNNTSDLWFKPSPNRKSQRKIKTGERKSVSFSLFLQGSLTASLRWAE